LDVIFLSITNIFQYVSSNRSSILVKFNIDYILTTERLYKLNICFRMSYFLYGLTFSLPKEFVWFNLVDFLMSG